MPTDPKSKAACERYRAWRIANADYVRQRNRKWWKANADKINERRRRNHAADPDKSRNENLRWNYGVNLTQFAEMKAAQDDRCAICGKRPSGRGASAVLHVDHDHATGKIRALLCSSCNLGIGKFYENPELLQAARDYIIRWTATHQAEDSAQQRLTFDEETG